MRLVLGLFIYFLPSVVSSSKANFLARQLPQQDVCLTQVTVEHQIAPIVGGQPVVIITPILSNTVITPSPFSVPITISNAPTVLNTTFTAYSTVTRTTIHTYITLTRAYRGTITFTTTILNPANPDATTTVFVLTPQASSTSTAPSLPGSTGSSLSQASPRYVTITSLYGGSTTRYSTIVPSSTGQNGVVLELVPSVYTTLTFLYDGSTINVITLTTPSAPGQTGTILVQSPRGAVPSPSSVLPSQNILPSTGILPALSSQPTAQSTPLLPAVDTSINVPASVSAPGPPSSIAIPTQGIPPAQLSTQVLPPTQSIPPVQFSTQVLPPPSTPTLPVPTSALQPPTVTASPQGTPTYQTITQLYTGSAPSLQFLATPTAPGDIGTVLLFLPSAYTTTTQLYTGPSSLLAPLTSTLATPVAPGETGTVQVLVPKIFVTRASLYPGSSIATSTLVDPVVVGQTGTVVVLLPSVYSTRSALYAGLVTATSTLAVPTAVGQTGEVLVQVPSVYVTITSTYTGVTTASSVLFGPTVPGQTGTLLVQVPQGVSVRPSSSSGVSSLVVSPAPTGACGIQGASPDGACLSTLPPACRNLASPSLLGTLLSKADALACQAELGVFGTVNAVGCFSGSLLSSLTGANLLTCIESNVPSCNSCLDTLPSSCSSLGSTSLTSVLGIDPLALSACKQSLGVFTFSSAAACFAVSNPLFPPTGPAILQCLLQNIPICPSPPATTPASLLTPTTVLACDGTPQPTSCVPGLPPQCTVAVLVPPTEPLGPVRGILDTVACQTALGALGTVNAAICFSRSLLATFTDWDFISCLSTRVPLCDRCVAGLPNACQVAGLQRGGVCQAALGLYGITTAATCFAGDVVEQLVDDSLAGCLGQRLPFCGVGK